jgi:hypothetical protein
MGLLDSVKKLGKTAKDKADDLAEQHGDKVKKGLDKVGDVVDKRTKGKHGAKIDKAVDKAKAKVDDLAEPEPGEPRAAGEGAGPSGDAASPADPPQTPSA